MSKNPRHKAVPDRILPARVSTSGARRRSAQPASPRATATRSLSHSEDDALVIAELIDDDLDVDFDHETTTASAAEATDEGADRHVPDGDLPSATDEFTAWWGASPELSGDAVVEEGAALVEYGALSAVPEGAPHDLVKDARVLTPDSGVSSVAERPGWVAEVPDRGYYDPELRSPEWIRRRGRPDNRADLRPDHRTSPRSEVRSELHGDRWDGVDEWTDTVRRGRAFPTSYRASFVSSDVAESDLATGT